MRAPSTPDETLAFELRDGLSRDAFFREGPIAAHLVATAGRAPRLLVAFPAGNTGAGIWCEPLPEGAAFEIERPPASVRRDGGLVGVTVTVVCPAPELRVRRAALGNVRALRRLAHGGELPAAFACAADAGPPFTLHRTTLDGRRITLSLSPRGGSVRADGERWVVRGDGGPLHLTLTALTDHPPLTPIPARELLRPGVTVDERALRALAFLAYEEKLLAGSWRFLTYFGRDTLLSLQLLGAALRPGVVEAGLGAVIERLSARGEVAHEEAVGEEAAAQNLAAGRADLEAPVLDHEMIDDDFLLAPVLAEHLLRRAPPERARAFLARRTPAGESYAAALGRNLGLVMRKARPFVAAPSASSLITLGEGRLTGDWRDSEEGLGFGRAPYGVNAALVPAALEAAAELVESPLLGGDVATAAHARALGAAFAQAETLFEVALPEEEARRRVEAYARALDIDPAPAVASIHGQLRFPGIALDERGAPVPVMSSDEGFVLLFGRPAPDALAAAARRMTRPFPAGLRTPVGMVVANPALAPEAATRALFTAGHYHGTVVWSWQQALLSAGLDRQLGRGDLPPEVRAVVEEASAAVREARAATAAWRTAELWSFSCSEGSWAHVPFGAEAGHHTESNAVQLWSTVGLGVG